MVQSKITVQKNIDFVCANIVEEPEMSSTGRSLQVKLMCFQQDGATTLANDTFELLSYFKKW